jgi:ABC-2 type transport system permease protein
LFFALAFPVIFILLFGAIFSGAGSGSVAVYVQNLDANSSVSAAFIQSLNSTGVLNVKVVDISGNLSNYLLAHSLSNGIVIPQGFASDYEKGKSVNVTVYSDPADSTSGIVLGAVSGVINGFNLKRVEASPVVGLDSATVNAHSTKYIDFLVPGLIGFSILTSPMFSMVNVTAEYKKFKRFKQLSLTPLTKGEWLVSKVIWYTILSFAAFVLMVFFGTAVFGANLKLSLIIIPFLIAGPTLFISLGMLVGIVTKSIESAGVIGNIITFPMMFLSGTFFPISTMPHFLQLVARFLPLYYVIAGLNDVMVFSNISTAYYNLAVTVAIAAVIFVLAARLFKWKEK